MDVKSNFISQMRFERRCWAAFLHLNPSFLSRRLGLGLGACTPTHWLIKRNWLNSFSPENSVLRNVIACAVKKTSFAIRLNSQGILNVFAGVRWFDLDVDAVLLLPFICFHSWSRMFSIKSVHIQLSSSCSIRLSPSASMSCTCVDTCAVCRAWMRPFLLSTSSGVSVYCVYPRRFPYREITLNPNQFVSCYLRASERDLIAQAYAVVCDTGRCAANGWQKLKLFIDNIISIEFFHVQFSIWMDFPYNDFEYTQFTLHAYCPLPSTASSFHISESHRHHHQLGLNAIEKQ